MATASPGIAELVRARERRLGQEDAAMLVTENMMVGGGADFPVAPLQQQRRTDALGLVGDGGGGDIVMHQRQQRHALFGDPGFFKGNACQRITWRARFGCEQEFAVVDAQAGDAGDQRLVDDIGRIEAPAKANFDDCGIRRGAGKGEEGRRRRRFEETGAMSAEASSTSASSDANAASSISWPATRMRSLKRTRCGLV